MRMNEDGLWCYHQNAVFMFATIKKKELTKCHVNTCCPPADTETLV